MRIIVCVRQGLDGELGAFDAAAYEMALRIEGAEVTLLSMGAPSTSDFLKRLTRLGASRAILLSDKAFAGADTLATAYTLSLAIKRLSPDLVLCGRQTLVGDTAQTGAMLSVFLGSSLVTNAFAIESLRDGFLECTTRDEGKIKTTLPALLTVERTYTLRLPRLGSKPREVEVLGAADIGADLSRVGLAGSPTRVVKSFENTDGKRSCKFIKMSELSGVIAESLKKSRNIAMPKISGERLGKVCTVGDAPLEFARTVSDNIEIIPLSDCDEIIEKIKEHSPDAVLWGSDTKSKRLAAVVAAKLSLGLCADSTALECEGGELMMYRPALSGSVIAKIRNLTTPAMATVRTEDKDARDIIVAAGFGAKDSLERVKELAKELHADVAASRRIVDEGLLPYEKQVGLTGKTVAPPIYIAIGISGAVHHLAGMGRAGTVIAINPDKNAPIFDYADYGITEEF